MRKLIVLMLVIICCMGLCVGCDDNTTVDKQKTSNNEVCSYRNYGEIFVKGEDVSFCSDEKQTLVIGSETFEMVDTFLIDKYDLSEFQGTRLLIEGNVSVGQNNNLIIEPIMLVTDSLFILTPYMNFEISENWHEFITVKSNEEKTTYEFIARFEEKEYGLFDIYFDDERGEEIGFVADNSGNRIRVSVEMNQSINLSGLEKTYTDCFYAMREELNSIIASLEK